jgi:hypothetical protein
MAIPLPPGGQGPLPWYKDRTVMVPALAAILAAIIGVVGVVVGVLITKEEPSSKRASVSLDPQSHPTINGKRSSCRAVDGVGTIAFG